MGYRPLQSQLSSERVNPGLYVSESETMGYRPLQPQPSSERVNPGLYVSQGQWGTDLHSHSRRLRG